MPIEILLIEDNPGDARLLQEHLREAGTAKFNLTHLESLDEGISRLQACAKGQSPYDILLLDLSLPGSSGLKTVRRAQEGAPRTPIVVLTGLDDEETGIEAVRMGVQDYLIKGHVDQRTIARAIRYAIERKRAEEQLRELNETLEQRVAERTAMAEERASQLRALANELTQSEQRQRRRFAQMLHDELQQLLIAAKFRVGALRSRTSGEEQLDAVDQVDELLDESIKASRVLTIELSPPILYDAGLVPALEWLAGWMREKHGLTTAVDANEEAEPDSEDIRILLFEAVRELLFNVVKHAQIDEATVLVQKTPNDEITVTVEDTGAGFDPKSAQDRSGGAGFGLFSILERFGLVGGHMDIETAPGMGTRVTLRVPGSA
ncbi:MAG TPA: response regulator [Candidatus Bathyarchaeia archaeon]|nr:response regulator [Candidatus Bathyarchaeia archaeon]